MKDNRTKIFLQVVLVLTSIFLLIKIQPFLLPILEILGMLIIPIIIGSFLFYALRPLKNFLLKLVKKDSLAAILSILIVLVLMVIFFTYGGSVVKDQFEDAFVKNRDQIVEYKDYIDGKIQEVLPNLNIVDKINDNIKSLASSIGSNAMGIFSSVGDIASQIILIPLVMFYLLKDGGLFKEKFFSKLPKKYKPEIQDLFKKSDKILSTYINGQLLVALIVGILMFIGYLIVGMPNALLMATFAIITSVVPAIGAFLGILPALLIALTIKFSLAVKVVIMTIIVQQIESNLVSPKIMGDRLALHPLGVIVIVIVSIKLIGILGAVIGTPLFLVTMNLFKTIYKIWKKSKKEKNNA